MLVLQLNGSIPAKKNNINFGRGRFYRTQDYHDFLEYAHLALKSQYKGEPLKTERIQLNFFQKRTTKDLDNLISTVLDVLQSSRVIENDKLINDIRATKGQNNQEKVIIQLYDKND